MKKFLYLLLALNLLFTSCSDDDQPKYVGSGNIISETRTLDSFTDVHISSVINADIVFGSAQGVSVSADDNIIDLVKTEVRQNTIFVYLEDGSYDEITVNVTITNTDLSELSSEGVNNIDVSGFEQLDDLTVHISGVGNLEMSGSVTDLTLNSSGSMNASAFDLITENSEIILSGVGNVSITVNNQLTGSVSGVGNIFYKGNPTVGVTVSGVGNVIDSN